MSNGKKQTTTAPAAKPPETGQDPGPKKRRVAEGNVRLLTIMPEDMIKRLDLYAEYLSFDRKGSTVTRSDAIRAAILNGLDYDQGFNEWVEAGKPPAEQALRKPAGSECSS